MLAEPNCFKRRCMYYIGVDQPDGTELSERVICEAFPEGIPDEIAYGDNKHDKPLPDQGNDIVYERDLEVTEVLSHVTSALRLTYKLGKIFKLCDLITTKEDEKNINILLSRISSIMGGPPLIIFKDDKESPSEYDTYLEAAIDEITHVYKVTKEAITTVNAIGYTVQILATRPENFFRKEIKEDLRDWTNLNLEKRFYDQAEISYIRLGSYWDRIGQLLAYIFFNIRQFDHEVFSSVLERIQTNYIHLHPNIKNSCSWKRLRKYQNRDKDDGYQWLVRRRNLLVHSLHLYPPDNVVELHPIFISTYNHLNEKTKDKLKPRSMGAECTLLHIHLEKASLLFKDVLELALLGAEAQESKHTRI